MAICISVSAFYHAEVKKSFLKYETSYFLIRLLNYLGICPFLVLSLGNRLEALYQCTILPSLWTDFTQVFGVFFKGKNKMGCLPQVLNFRYIF